MEWVEVCSIPSFFVIIDKHVFPEEYGTELQERQTHNCQIAMDVIIKPDNFKNIMTPPLNFSPKEHVVTAQSFGKRKNRNRDLP